MRTPPVQRHSGTHKVSGEPEHKDQGYLLLLVGSKLLFEQLPPDVFSKTDGVIRTVTRGQVGPSAAAEIR